MMRRSAARASRSRTGGDAAETAESRLRLAAVGPGWRRQLPHLERLRRRLAPLLPCPIRLVLTEDRVLRRLKRRYLGHDAPTNVLSFPDPDGAGGEVLLALGVLRREAAAEGKRFVDHFAHLVLHGALHVVGHTHEEAGEARRMERLEARLLRRAGFANPWRRI